ncbi:uncharacterized protein LOC108101735 [Drosophila ficusphila]|uniref:uncharacterized protein LOC108101735 n=1 Tax=Drosophila ficusphila TaxID=30025 RepID=UPI0007E72680|nr:uncharacterized protein LOC108101735 [Drosophila ficusphila]
MKLFLLAVSTLLLLNPISGLATHSDKEKFCNFLEGVEHDRLGLADTLTDKALEVAEKVIKKLGRNSSFEKFINDNLVELSIAIPEQKIEFLLKFRCNFKKMILCNRSYSGNPEFRNIYNSYKSDSNKEIAKFDELLTRDAYKMLMFMRSTSTSTKDEFNDALETYLNRKGVNAHCMMDRFLKLKSKYECTYQMTYL